MTKQSDEYISIPLLNPAYSSTDSGDEDSVCGNPHLTNPKSRATDQIMNGLAKSNGSMPRRKKSVSTALETKIAVEDRKFCSCRNGFLQHNWISVFLLSTILAWIMWMGAKELFGHLNRAEHRHHSRLSHCPSVDGWTELDPVLLSMNHGGREHLLDLHDCSLDVTHKLTIRRLTLRSEQRRNASLNNPVPYPAHSELYLTPMLLESRPAKGLGNWIFSLAAVYGISRQHRWYWSPGFPSVSEEVPLVHQRKSYFNQFPLETAQNGTKYKHIKTAGFATYDPVVEKLDTLNPNISISLDGYLQACRYFDLYRSDIRQLFLFKHEIYATAIMLVSNLLDDYLKISPSTKNWNRLPNLVGIHVRRGDILEERYRSEGHEPATEAYLLRATLHMEMNYVPAVFVVVTNDVGYCRKIFKGESFLFVENQREEIDMAVLTLMDYIVLSVGSFGWWAAYLSDAREVYYYKYWPRNGTQMYGELVPNDYFLPSWTAFE